MGMILALVSVADDNGRRCLADPPLVVKIISPGDHEAYDEARAQLRSALPIWQRWLRDLRPRAVVDELRAARGERKAVDLDKAWHGIHYLLTQTAFEGAAPLDFLLRGGAELGRLEVGLGPARWLDAAGLQAVHAALEAMDDAGLRARFDAQAMMDAQIYPEIWSRDPAEDDTLGYLMANLATLRSFVRDCAAAGLGCIIYIA